MIDLVHMIGKGAAMAWLQHTHINPAEIARENGFGRFRLVDMSRPFFCDFLAEGDPSDGWDFVRDFHLCFIPNHHLPPTPEAFQFWKEFALIPWSQHTKVLTGNFCDEKSG